jgi:hypothetical protein
MEFNEVFIAQITDRIGPKKYAAKIKTGNASGSDCLIRCRNYHKDITGNVVITLKPSRNDNETLFGDFVTSNIPTNFEYCESQNAIFHGSWQEDDTPNIRKVELHFNPNPIREFLYLEDSESEIAASYIAPKKIRKSVDCDFTRKNLNSIIREYIRIANPDYHKTIIINQKIPDYKSRLDHEIKQIGLHPIEMEPINIS